jgi:predicted nucleic acid-binding protein
MIFVDTNVLLYALGVEHPAREPARRILAAVGEGQAHATTTADVIQEFAHVYSRRRPHADAARHALSYVALFAPLAVVGQAEVERALGLFERHEGLGAADAVLAATAQASEVQALVSADRAFAAVDDLRFVELGSSSFDRLLA